MNDMPIPKESIHLGDGAYAVFDGFQFWVLAERDAMIHKVALEFGILRRDIELQLCHKWQSINNILDEKAPF
jgi:hypothetical protein